MKHLFLSSSSVLQGLDWLVLSIYFLALIAVAVWVVLQKNKNTELSTLKINSVISINSISLNLIDLQYF